MFKHISVYQLALYLKGGLKPKDIEDMAIFSFGNQEQIEKYEEYRDLYDTNNYWSRIQFLLFMNPDLNKKCGDCWWYHYDISEDEEESSWEDPNYMPDMADNYSEISTNDLIKNLEIIFEIKRRKKYWVEIAYPEEIKIIKKGGRWRNRGKALKMSA